MGPSYFVYLEFSNNLGEKLSIVMINGDKLEPITKPNLTNFESRKINNTLALNLRKRHSSEE